MILFKKLRQIKSLPVTLPITLGLKPQLLSQAEGASLDEASAFSSLSAPPPPPPWHSAPADPANLLALPGSFQSLA